MDIKSKKVLVVDDNELAVEAAKILLEGIGCKVDTVCKGEDAIRLARQNNNYDLIIMDLNMFDMDGFNVSKQLRQLTKAGIIKETPIVALSMYDIDSLKWRAFELGFEAYIKKPLTNNICKTLLHVA